jgi:hypothetical protein
MRERKKKFEKVNEEQIKTLRLIIALALNGER